MQKPFTFNQPYLLVAMGLVFVASSVLAYRMDASEVVGVCGFALLMFAGASPRARAGTLWSFYAPYPPPNRVEGAIGAIGVSAIFGALIAAVAPRVVQWIA